MLTLSYGFKRPETGDRGSIFFPALEDDITQLNNHTHNGVDSAIIPSSSSVATTQAILAASWVSVGGGTYRQEVTMTTGLAYDSFRIEFRDTSTKYQYYLTVERTATNKYYVYINDNTKNITALYLA